MAQDMAAAGGTGQRDNQSRCGRGYKSSPGRGPARQPTAMYVVRYETNLFAAAISGWLDRHYDFQQREFICQLFTFSVIFINTRLTHACFSLFSNIAPLPI